jgi:hypothetical protein
MSWLWRHGDNINMAKTLLEWRNGSMSDMVKPSQRCRNGSIYNCATT